jgi:hypothetical protein
MSSALAAPAPVLAHPPAPTLLAEAGLSIDLMVQLALKHLHFAGELSGTDLSGRLGVRFTVVEPALDALKAQYHVEVLGGSLLGPASFRYRITDAGRERVRMFLDHNQYVGPAPVPLSQYVRYMRAHREATPRNVTRETVREAFDSLVLAQSVLDQLGPAVNAGHSLFVYGPPGNGKSVISSAIGNLLAGDLAVPHALEAEGQIVRVFDPVNHRTLPLLDAEGLDAGTGLDRRWARCRRPSVLVGGELTLASLELWFNEVAGFYHAPVQLVANGGVLVIDDFGRQQCDARQFLNRWIVPLENRVDYLTLQTGQKFEVPFDVLLVFATNLKPSSLVDEAFLRRIRYKVFAESPTVREFHEIFRRCCADRHLAFDPSLVDGLLHDSLRPRNVALRGCHPRDLIDQALSLADYRGEPRVLNADLLEAACAGYFVDDREPDPVYA